MNDQSNANDSEPSRRDFVKTATVAAAAATAAMSIPKGVYAAGSGTIKVGLVGCGGRGSGAAQNAMHAGKDIKLVAMGDMFQDKLDEKVDALKADAQTGPQVDVPKDRQYVGWDAYKNVIDQSDMVILATPPHFRPMHLQAVLEAGKHCFCEKPVAVDAPGVRRQMATSEMFAKKKLSLVSGLCYRYDAQKIEVMKRIHAGDIGKITALQCNYITKGLWSNARKPEWSDMEWQLRNWLYFTWLSGDMITEQHIHSLDKMMWVMKDVPPAKCYATGGRTVRTERPQFGNVYDHFATVYEWEDGTKLFAHARQFTNATGKFDDRIFTDVSDYVFGTDGMAAIQSHIITGKNPYKDPAKKRVSSTVMYDAEHVALANSIRDGKPINNGDYMCKSTMMAIMGRMAAYTGREVTWEEALASKEDLSPAKYAFGPLALPDVAIPGSKDLA
ncbi:MAG TPA: Gfo/Idh/MocA family oxidoreductase [Humisphaera sp.]|jgi:predicted dehydrogenase|nr:Gfo/Idh/MocA family oxidoreductase [Humisphaera sp.]